MECPLFLANHNVYTIGFDGKIIRDTLLKQEIELVLTAHPTQAARRTLLDKYFKIAELLEFRDKTVLYVDHFIDSCGH